MESGHLDSGVLAQPAWGDPPRKVVVQLVTKKQRLKRKKQQDGRGHLVSRAPKRGSRGLPLVALRYKEWVWKGQSLPGGGGGTTTEGTVHGWNEVRGLPLGWIEERGYPSIRLQTSQGTAHPNDTQTPKQHSKRSKKDQVTAHLKHPLFPRKTAKYQKRSHPTVLTHGWSGLSENS